MELEELTYEEALKLAVEVMEIKEHQVILAECGGYCGYSALVFKNGKHIYYANDYEIHHRYKVETEGKSALRHWYIDTLNRKLYTDAELLEPINSYDEYESKRHFLCNYYIMRYDYVSSFGIGKEDHKKIREAKKDFPFFNSVSFCWVADAQIVETQARYMEHLQREFERLKSGAKTFRDMVRYELSNHEACITSDYTAALDALGLKFEDLTQEQQKIVKCELRRQINRY